MPMLELQRPLKATVRSRGESEPTVGAYYDGHVGEITQKDMETLDRRGGNNNSFWKGNNGTP